MRLGRSSGEAGSELFHAPVSWPDQPRGHAAVDPPRGERLFDQGEGADGSPFAEAHPAEDDAVRSHNAVPPEVDAASLDIPQLLRNDRAGEPLTQEVVIPRH